MLKESTLVPNRDIGKNTGGCHLRPAGGRIVDPGPTFRMTDLLTFAGVDPAARHARKPGLA